MWALTGLQRSPTVNVLANLVGPDGLIIIIVLVVVLLFGGNKLPKLARGLGSASHEFKKGMAEGDPDADSDAAAGEKNDKPASDA
jgi:sec-independent protein translocase protein TatA